MNFASSSPIAKSGINAASASATVWLTGLAPLIVLAFAICLASSTPGTTLNELAFMAAFP